MTSEDALRQFIDSRIKPELQEHYPVIVAAYRVAWEACNRFRDGHIEPADEAHPSLRRTPRTVPNV